jgi:hypothetical protein
MEKANEYAVDSLKQILTLAGAILALTVTFLKDVLGETRDSVTGWFIVPVAWVFLIVSLVFAWLAIVEAADKLGTTSGATSYVFARRREGTTGFFSGLGSWFVPFIPTAEKNRIRKLAATAQNYFVLALILLSVFAAINFRAAFRKTPATPSPEATLEANVSLFSYSEAKPAEAQNTPTVHCKHSRRPRYRHRR